MNHVAPISGIAAFSDKYISTAGYDNQLILWNAKTKEPIQRVFHDHLCNQCSFSRNGNLLVSASSDYSARIWEVPSLRLKVVLAGHNDDVEMAVFNPSEDTVATCSRDHTIRLFRASNGECRSILQGHEADVISVTWAADGKTLISSSDDGTIRRWCAIGGHEVERIDLDGVETDTIAISSDGTIFAGDDEGRLTVISESGRETINAHLAGIKRVVWNDERHWLISLSYDRSVVLWTLKDRCLSKFSESLLPSVIWPRSCTFLGDGQIAFVTFGSTYAIWDYRKNKWDLSGIRPATSLNAVSVKNGDVYTIGDAGIFSVNGKKSREIGSLCNFLLPFGESILTGGQMGQIIDAISGELICQHRSPLNCGVTFFRDDCQYAAVGAYTGEILIFGINSNGRPIYIEDVKAHNNAIKGLAANEKHLFSVCATASAAFHRITDFGLERYIEHAHARISNACTRIAGGFASVGRDLMLRLWINDEAEIYETPHQHSVKCIAASIDERFIATGSYGGSIAVFDLELRSWIHQCRPTASGISCITFSMECNQFIASSYDGNLYYIDAFQ